jgi:hypothetical protein
MFSELTTRFIDYVDVDGDDVSKRDLVGDILGWAESYIYEIYGVSILERSITEVLNGTGNGRIYVSRGNIKTIEVVTIGGVDVDVSTLTFNKNLIYYSDSTFTSGTDNVYVEYTIGYTTPEVIPSALVNALFIIGRKMFNDAAKNYDNYSLLSTDIKQSIKPLDVIPQMAVTVLEAYKIYRL